LCFLDLRMNRVLCPIAINMYYRCGASPEEKSNLFSLRPQPINHLTPKVRDIEIRNLDAKECRASAGFIVGLPESPVENLVIEHCCIELAQDQLVHPSESEMFEGIPEISARGMRIRHAHYSFHDIEILGLPKGEVPIQRRG